MDRRSFIGKSSASLLVMASGARALATAVAGPLRRLDIETFSKDPALVGALRKCFATLKARPPSSLVGNFN